MEEPGHSKKQSPQSKAVTQQGKHQILQLLIWHLGLIMKLAMLQRAQETSPLQSAAYSTYHSSELTLLHTEGSLPAGRAPVILASSHPEVSMAFSLHHHSFIHSPLGTSL